MVVLIVSRPAILGNMRIQPWVDLKPLSADQPTPMCAVCAEVPVDGLWCSATDLEVLLNELPRDLAGHGLKRRRDASVLHPLVERREGGPMLQHGLANEALVGKPLLNVVLQGRLDAYGDVEDVCAGLLTVQGFDLVTKPHRVNEDLWSTFEVGFLPVPPDHASL
jgi:hypothetical protein